ncbi:hypothetical protein N5J23_18220, partial [Comamonas aquatica]
SILTGAGINMAIANECLPAQQQHLMDLTYQKVSQNIYNQLPANWRCCINRCSASGRLAA